jgi:hypothetical protein
MGWPIGWTDLKPLLASHWQDWRESQDWWGRDPSEVPYLDTIYPRTVKSYPDLSHRLKAIGNGQVPKCAATAWTNLGETK